MEEPALFPKLKEVRVKRQPAHVRAQERRVVMPGRRPGDGRLGQVDADRSPAGRGEVAGLGAQAAADVQDTPARR